MAQSYERKSTRPQTFPIVGDPRRCTAINWLQCSLFFLADFKLGAGIARNIKQRFPTQYPYKEAIASEVIWPQWITESQCFVYHLITKARYFHKPTYKALRVSFQAKQRHAQSNNVQRISLPQIVCGFDKLNWQKIRQLIHEVFQPRSIDLAVILKLHSWALNSNPNGFPNWYRYR